MNYPRKTSNLWRVDQLDGQQWRILYYQSDHVAVDCGQPTARGTPLNLILEFIEFHADKHDVIAVNGSFYQHMAPSSEA